MYAFLDIFFLVLHSVVIVINLFGWIWVKTRRLNLYLLSLTALSWLGLGFWYGWGYCPLTDWHWQVLEKLGKDDIPNSYIKYLADRITGLDFDAVLVNNLVAWTFGLAFVISILINARDYRRKKNA